MSEMELIQGYVIYNAHTDSFVLVDYDENHMFKMTFEEVDDPMKGTMISSIMSVYGQATEEEQEELEKFMLIPYDEEEGDMLLHFDEAMTLIHYVSSFKRKEE